MASGGAANHWELNGREIKVARLVQEIDRTLRASGIDPYTQAAAVAVTLSDQWGRLQWAQAALMAAVRPPSDETKRQVIARYRARAEEAREEQERGDSDLDTPEDRAADAWDDAREERAVMGES